MYGREGQDEGVGTRTTITVNQTNSRPDGPFTEDVLGAICSSTAELREVVYQHKVRGLCYDFSRDKELGFSGLLSRNPLSMVQLRFS